MESTNVSMAEEQVISSKKPINLLLLGIVIGAAIGGLAMWAFFNVPTSSPQVSIDDTNSTLSTNVPAGWKLYENKEIGIVFEYPEAWGQITVSHEKGCAPDVNYYGQAKVAEMQAEIEATGDPCEHLQFLFGQTDFMATYSVLAAKYPNPRGGYWGDTAASIKDDAYIENFCKNETKNCSIVTNSNGVRVAFVDRDGCDGMGCSNGRHYLIRSPHKFYFGVVLLAPDNTIYSGSDFDRLVDSLRFIQ